MSEQVPGDNGREILENKKIQQEKLSCHLIVHSPPQHNKNPRDLSADAAGGDGEIPVIVYEIYHFIGCLTYAVVCAIVLAAFASWHGSSCSSSSECKLALDFFFRASITAIAMLIIAAVFRRKYFPN